VLIDQALIDKISKNTLLVQRAKSAKSWNGTCARLDSIMRFLMDEAKKEGILKPQQQNLIRSQLTSLSSLSSCIRMQLCDLFGHCYYYLSCFFLPKPERVNKLRNELIGRVFSMADHVLSLKSTAEDVESKQSMFMIS
jgi:hypothetical protein